MKASLLILFVVLAGIGCGTGTSLRHERRTPPQSQTPPPIEAPPTESNAIDLNNWTKIRDLSTGKTNKVSLWENKNNSNEKIVVKEPQVSIAILASDIKDLIEHNIRSINLFFDKGSAWPVKDRNAFAMRYFKGTQLSKEEENSLINNDK